MFEYNSTVLAIANQKGGVGKTTAVSVLGEYGALEWKIPHGSGFRNGRILIVDLDIQCNTSDYWIGMEAAKNERGGQLPPRHPDYDGSDDLTERSTIADIFYGKSVMQHSAKLEGKEGPVEVDVILGHPALLEDVNEEFDKKSGEIDQRVVNRLGELLHDADVSSYYDLVLLDTGPSRNAIFRAALRAATHVLVPYEAEEKSLQGINAMAHAISNENFNRKRGQPPLKVVGMLPNKVRSGIALHKDNIKKVSLSVPTLAMPDGIYLPLSTEFPKRDVKGVRPKSIFNLAPSKPARVKAVLVCEYVYDSIFGNQAPENVEEVAVLETTE